MQPEGFHLGLAGGGASQRLGQQSWLRLTLPWAVRCSICALGCGASPCASGLGTHQGLGGDCTGSACAAVE